MMYYKSSEKELKTENISTMKSDLAFWLSLAAWHFNLGIWKIDIFTTIMVYDIYSSAVNNYWILIHIQSISYKTYEHLLRAKAIWQILKIRNHWDHKCFQQNGSFLKNPKQSLLSTKDKKCTIFAVTTLHYKQVIENMNLWKNPVPFNKIAKYVHLLNTTKLEHRAGDREGQQNINSKSSGDGKKQTWWRRKGAIPINQRTKKDNRTQKLCTTLNKTDVAAMTVQVQERTTIKGKRISKS